MARIEVTTHVEAPVEVVWRVLVDWERQRHWMVDVRAIEVTTDQREGVGVRLRCRTDVLGFAVRDDLVVTEWVHGAILGIQHVGRVIAGVGAFELRATDAGTHVVWWEEARVPLGTVGDAAADVLIVPWVRRTFRRSLARFKRLAEAAAV